MRVERETHAHVPAVQAVTGAAFSRPEQRGAPPPEVELLERLRNHETWLPALSLVAVEDGAAAGHVLCTRARVNDMPALALGPLSVRPDRQRRGVGSALMHAVLGAGDALDEPLVVLLGDPRYYARFGFRLAHEHGVSSPKPEWRDQLQARALSAHTPSLTGRFEYAEPFYRV